MPAPGVGTFFSLAQINSSNVTRLKVAWALGLGSLRSQESTPLVVGDTLYVTSSHGPKNVLAVDAKTGALRWRYSPDVPAGIDQFGCCDVNNRGVAYANGKVFVGRLDGHLVALDARSGKELWKTLIVDYTQGSIITSRPTIVKNLVITGFGGGEFGARGFIAALDQDTGKIVWHYQSTPHDAWDYDGVNELVLTDISVNGQKTPVALNGDNRAQVFYATVTNGRPDKGMPRWSGVLDCNAIEHVWAFLESVQTDP